MSGRKERPRDNNTEEEEIIRLIAAAERKHTATGADTNYEENTIQKRRNKVAGNKNLAEEVEENYR